MSRSFGAPLIDLFRLHEVQEIAGVVREADVFLGPQAKKSFPHQGIPEQGNRPVLQAAVEINQNVPA
jgi:hypothetical protein